MVDTNRVCFGNGGGGGGGGNIIMQIVPLTCLSVCPVIVTKAENLRKFNSSLPMFTILFYPITLEGHRGTTDEFATIPFHLDLFSAALVKLAKSIPVHSLILSSHLFFCLPLFLFPFTVPCRTVFAIYQKTLRHGQTILAFVS